MSHHRHWWSRLSGLQSALSKPLQSRLTDCEPVGESVGEQMHTVHLQIKMIAAHVKSVKLALQYVPGSGFNVCIECELGGRRAYQWIVVPSNAKQIFSFSFLLVLACGWLFWKIGCAISCSWLQCTRESEQWTIHRLLWHRIKHLVVLSLWFLLEATVNLKIHASYVCVRTERSYDCFWSKVWTLGNKVLKAVRTDTDLYLHRVMLYLQDTEHKLIDINTQTHASEMPVVRKAVNNVKNFH